MAGDRFETYRMGQGVYFDDRVNDFEQMLADHFDGRVDETVTVEVAGEETTCHIVEDVGVDGLNRVVAGRHSPSTKKDRLVIRFVETHPKNLSPDADAREAVESKNEFLHAVTGRTAEDRKQSWENDVEE